MMKRQALLRLLSPTILLIASGLFVSRAAAQQQRLSVVVEYIAGANLYIDAGAEEGIGAGDTLYVYNQSDGTLLGTFRVLNTSQGRSVVTFAGRPFPITRGDALDISFVPAPLSVEAQRAAAEARQAEERRRAAARAPLQIDGRLSFSISALQSTTQGRVVGLEPIDRTFTTPTGRLRLTASHLPGDLTFQTNLKTTARYSSNDLIQPSEAFRVYQLHLEKSFQELPLFVRLGRFYNPFERYSGYWDGLLIRVGADEGLGVGIAAGFHPDRLNENFSSQMPKYTAFVNYKYRDRLFGYRADASVHHIRNRSGVGENTYLGFSQRLRYGGWRVSQDLQVDRDLERGSWNITQLQVNTSVSVNRSVAVHGRYSLRQPSILSPLDSLLPLRRDQGGFGLTLRVLNGSVGGDVTGTRVEGREFGYTYSSFLNFPRTGLWALGFSASGSYWIQGTSTTLYLSGGVTREFGRTQTRAFFSRYASETEGTKLVTQGGELAVTLPLMGRVFSTLRAAVQRSKNLSSNSLDAQLWMSF